MTLLDTTGNELPYYEPISVYLILSITIIRLSGVVDLMTT